jgi:hypothetical protein
MKKWLPVTAFIFIAALASIYIFIPGRLNIIQITPVNCTTPGAYRHMATPDKWKNWWPRTASDTNTLRYKNNSFEITKTLINTLKITILHNSLPINSTLHLIPVTGDSTNIEWSCHFTSGLNPFKRIQHYRQAVTLKNNMAAILSHFKSFAEKKENMYGISFHDAVYKDSFLISTKTTMASYPAVADIYSMINSLKKYSAIHKAKQTGAPIMNITPLHPSGFQVMTAIPINRLIPANGAFINQRIPMNHFLVTRVHGGDAAVNQALQQIQFYIQDYRRTVMALPFQQLITDRSAEPDTTRWVTDIYVPLF